MRDAPSRTAEAVCFMRASDQRRQPHDRILDDPQAKRFLGPLLRATLATMKVGGRFANHAEAYSPGLLAYILTRHRCIDDALIDALGDGIDQLVLLGAGYDTRPWRLADALGDTRVFAVDHPSTGRRKAKVVAKHPVDFPDVGVVPVAIDFQTQSLKIRLLEAGFQPGKRTFVVWEGVSMYLTRDAVKATLTTMHSLCGPGSELMMDFWYMVDAPDVVSTLLRMSPHLLHFVGEPVTFGIHPDDVDGFVARLGYETIDIAVAAELERRYVRDDRRVYPASYVVRMRIPA